MKIKDVQQCSFQNWYNNFKFVTIESLILPAPHSFVDYLLHDGIVLPQSDHPSPCYNISSDGSDDEVDWTENCNTEEATPPQFFEFDKEIEDAIEKLGGRVFPKLNWSSPQDASWIAFNNSCCCTSVSDIYLLLKSSSFIMHDLTNAYQQCEDLESSSNHSTETQYFLILRKWVEIDTSGEYRCFVRNNKLIGISQREHSLYFDHIAPNRKEIVEDIKNFFEKYIHLKFPSCNYIFDIYRKKKGYVRLIDFNPFGTVTDALLFSWDELAKTMPLGDELPEFRFVGENYGVQPRLLSYHALPKDIVDISSGEDSFKFADLLNLKIQEQKKDLSSDEEDS